MKFLEVHVECNMDTNEYSAHLPNGPSCHPSWCRAAYIPEDVWVEWEAYQKAYVTIQEGMEHAYDKAWVGSASRNG